MTKENIKGGNKPLLQLKIYRLTVEKTARILDQLTFALICSLAFIIPLAFSTRYLYSYEFPKFVLLLYFTIAVSIIFIIKISITGRKNLAQSAILSSLILFIFAYIISSIFSLSPITSITGQYGKWTLSLISLICFVLLAVITANTINTPKRKNILTDIVLISASIVSIISIVLTIFPSVAIFGEFLTSSSTQGHQIYLGILLTLILPIAISKIIEAGNWKKMIAYWIALLLIAVAIILGNSLGTWVIAIFTVLFYFNFYFKNYSKFKFRNFIVPAFVLIIIAAIVLFAISPLGRDKLATFKSNVDAFRFTDWRASLTDFVKRPITGIGPEVTSKYSNLYLTILATTGILGIAPFFILIFLSLLHSIKVINEKNQNFITIAIATSLIVWIFLGILYFPTMTFLVIGAILLGTITATEIPRQEKVTYHANPVLIIIIVLIGSLLATSIWRYQKAESLYKEVISYNQQEQSAGTVIPTIEQAIQYNNYERKYHEAKAYLLLSLIDEQKDRPNESEILRQIDNEVSLMVSLNPQNADMRKSAMDINYQEYLLSADSTYLGQSILHGEKLVKLEPDRGQNWFYLGVLYSLTNNSTKAKETFSKAVELEPAYSSEVDKYIQ